MSLLIRLQDIDITKKIAEAPDDDYSIGVFIGSFLPFLVLVLIAYVIYRYNKNRLKEE